MTVPDGEPEFLEIGRIERAHGLRGEVIVDFVTNLVEQRTVIGAEFWIDGGKVELATARPHGRKWLLRFTDVVDRESADRLRGATLTARPLPSDTAVFVHELIGRRVVDQHGTHHGEVTAVVDNPAADLLELSDGQLVPLTFYLRHDAAEVHVDVPLGLLER